MAPSRSLLRGRGSHDSIGKPGHVGGVGHQHMGPCAIFVEGQGFVRGIRLIRVGHRMEPTARAEEIIKHLSPALDSLSSALSLTHDFDPSISTM